MKGKRYWLLGLGLLVLIIAVSSWNFLSRTEDGRRLPPASIRIGTIPGDISAPIFLAQQLGYFSEENLKVDIVLFESGAEAVQSLLEGHVDLASAAEYVFVRQAFESPNLRILGVVATGQITEVLARAARGISQPEDLHGKRIGLVKGTHTEYYLARFLGFYGVPQKEVETVNTRPSEQAQALKSGGVDAIVAWEPYLSRIKRQIPKAETIVWNLRDHDFYWLLLGREQTLSEGDVQDRVMRALLQANHFLQAYPARGRQLVSQFIGEKEEPSIVWERYYFQFSLPQPLLSVMEEEARWTIENRLTDAKRVPNYLGYLDLASLNRVNARAVTVIQ